ncbi:MAG: hypothetical protein F4Y02_11265 [Chloroflexi bacterium]|nr:hypothetical protein [Chloroflexota bacterium]
MSVSFLFQAIRSDNLVTFSFKGSRRIIAVNERLTLVLPNFRFQVLVVLKVDQDTREVMNRQGANDSYFCSEQPFTDEDYAARFTGTRIDVSKPHFSCFGKELEKVISHLAITEKMANGCHVTGAPFFPD